ncbi:hypothetical protein ONZ51_g10403 [Trametes cubensis]|uniref:Uncharacterized protein n=1 Tax=Trametes cubensis TaxID=1111947 RepID=A0AAD7TM55_9APHY|nr:hypothetical protein ONZ51_g10403 [Trametes cubensis]
MMILLIMMIGCAVWTGRVGRVGDARVKLKCKGKLLPSEEGLLLVDDPGSDVQMRRDADIYNLQSAGGNSPAQPMCLFLRTAGCCLLPAGASLARSLPALKWPAHALGHASAARQGT